MSDVINARFSYEATFRNKRGSKRYTALLNGFQPILISEVAAQDAPVAYSISSGDALHAPFDVRLHEGALWWPVHGDHGPMTKPHFVTLAQHDWERANAVLDPLGRTYKGFGESSKQYFDRNDCRDVRSDIDEKALQVQKDAARLIYLDDIVHVDAGEPVWLARFNRETRWTFDLVIGPSSFDRRDRLGCHMPCVDRGTRLSAARVARAFGLGELDQGLQWLAPDVVHRISHVVATGAHVAGPAAGVCATAWAHYLWEIAWRYPNLHRLVPKIADAGKDSPPPAQLPLEDMLAAFVSIEGTEAVAGLPATFADAHLILERLARVESVENEEIEAALTSLGGVAA